MVPPSSVQPCRDATLSYLNAILPLPDIDISFLPGGDKLLDATLADLIERHAAYVERKRQLDLRKIANMRTFKGIR